MDIIISLLLAMMGPDLRKIFGEGLKRQESPPPGEEGWTVEKG